MRSLENLNWPIKEEDVDLVKREIELGEKYLQQSKDIRDFLLSREEVYRKESIIKSDKVIDIFDDLVKTKETNKTTSINLCQENDVDIEEQKY